MASTTRRGTGPGALGIISIVVGGVAALAVSSAIGVVVTAARTIVTPPRRRVDDVAVIGYDDEAATLTIAANGETVVDGRYGFWFSGNSGYARLGDIVTRDTSTVTRRVESVVFGDLARARSGRWSGWYYLTPADLGLDFEDVEIETPVGAAPAWLVPAEPRESSATAATPSRWAILVHGRAVTRAEALRALPVFHEAGYDCLVVSYRNDDGLPSPDGRYALGDREWRDVEAAMRSAVARGAEELVLMGYSMGGATVLQAATRSPLARRVRGIALDSPVIDWRDTLDHQIVAVRRLPRPVLAGVVRMLGSRFGRAAGVDHAIDFDRLDWVSRSAELTVPILIQHSDGDDFVPSTASRALALARPDLVRYEAFDTAKHTRLWNYDPERWTRTLREWLSSLADDGEQ